MTASSEYDELAPPKMHITQEELNKTQIPIALRDYCAHLMVTLAKCRTETNYLPWKCEMEKMAWEKCQYDDIHRRHKILLRRREKEALARQTEADDLSVDLQ